MYYIPSCPSIQSSSRFQEALENRPSPKGLARNSVWFHCQLPSLREKALKDRSELKKWPRLATGPLICELDIYESRSSQRTIFTNWIFMRRTPASEQYLQAQITLLLHIVYASLLCASIKRSLRLQQALQNRCDLGAGGAGLWLQLVVGDARNQSLGDGPLHDIIRPAGDCCRVAVC